jgi:hypothetical protein
VLVTVQGTEAAVQIEVVEDSCWEGGRRLVRTDSMAMLDRQKAAGLGNVGEGIGVEDTEWHVARMAAVGEVMKMVYVMDGTRAELESFLAWWKVWNAVCWVGAVRFGCSGRSAEKMVVGAAAEE